MKFIASVIVLSALAPALGQTTPISKVLDLLTGLQARITAEGTAAQKAYKEFSEWCTERSKNVGFEIKTGKADVEDLRASIEQQTALASSLSTKVEELGGTLATNEADLKAAEAIRATEASDFAAADKELTEVIGALQRAIGILEREMQKGGASALQLKNAGSVAQALSAMVQASVISSADAGKLTALVQNGRESEADTDENEESFGAPAAAVYKGHSGNIIDTLEDLLEKAEAQLADARKKETSSRHNFELLKQSLADEVKYAKQDMADAKKALSESGEKKAMAAGDLSLTSNALAEDETTLSELHQNCMAKTQDFEAATKSRDEELKALAEAKKVISETVSGAESITYEAASFLQLTRSQITSSADLANYEAVRFVRDLARKQHSPELAQLASRMDAVMRMNSGLADPFAKVKALIADMIEKLASAAGADASHKAYCDNEIAESQTKRDEKKTTIEQLSAKIDQMSARAAHLKGQVATLQKALAGIASSQAEMSKMRQEERATFVKNKAEMEQGLSGVRMALKILREYYDADGKAHEAAEGAATTIVGLLEVVESDFSKGLAEMQTTEDSSSASYDQETQANKIETASKTKSVQYKVKEAAGLDKAISEATSDLSSVQAELDAVNEYLGKLEDMCVAKPDTYEERARRREAEIAGLKEALKILEGEAVFLQGAKKFLHVVRPHARDRSADIRF